MLASQIDTNRHLRISWASDGFERANQRNCAEKGRKSRGSLTRSKKSTGSGGTGGRQVIADFGLKSADFSIGDCGLRLTSAD
jgi:hypothetical protein